MTMNENNNKNNASEPLHQEEKIAADIAPLAKVSKIWTIPIVALLLGLWMIYYHYVNLGSLITINFHTGTGIDAGKTRIKIKNVEIGRVEQLDLKTDLEGVTVTARIYKQYVFLLKEDSEFWVVRPRIGKGGFSGISTLVSGAYIEMSPGQKGSDEDEFDGLEQAPITPSGTAGLHLTLSSRDGSSFNEGDPILFQGIEVGRIENVYVNFKDRIIYYNAFIQSPYDKLVTTNTKFWKVSGLQINVSAEGIHFQTGTLETLISGGVTFDVPKDMPRGDVVTDRTDFTIYPNRDAIFDSRFKTGIQYILLFKESIRGLKPGASVEYRGIKLGTVTRTDVEYPEIENVLYQDTLIPVMITIEPARLGYSDDDSVIANVKTIMASLIKKGLRGGLATGNLLTGTKFIELKYDESVPNQLSKFDKYLVIPTLAGQFSQIMTKFSGLMDKLNNLPMESFLSTTKNTAAQLTQTLQSFSTTSQDLSLLLQQFKNQKLVKNINTSLQSIATLSQSYAEGSKTHQEIRATIINLKKSLQQLQPLLMQLNNKPNSLIFSDDKGDDFIPKGKK